MVLTMNYAQAAVLAVQREMTADPRVVVMGEDVGRGGIFGQYKGLQAMFGPERVIDTPISEAAIMGSGVGMALAGLRPVVEMRVVDFALCGMDEIVNQAAKNRYMFGGQASLPVVFRSAMFYGLNTGAHHSDRPYPMFMNVPGLKIMVPASPSDAKGLLRTAVDLDDPVLTFEACPLWSMKEEVSEEEYFIPFGVGRTLRTGSDLTIVAISSAVPEAVAVADTLAQEGLSVEVIDPRTLVPLDVDLIVRSVQKTGRLVIADPAHRTCGAAAEISAIIAEEAFESLRAPIVRVATPDTQIPFSPALEKQLYPSSATIAAAARKVLDVAQPAVDADFQQLANATA